MHTNYKNSYKSTEKELVSLAVYNVGYQKCDPRYQWGPGVRDHYLIHHIISGKGCLKVKQTSFDLKAGDSFLIYPDTEASYIADEKDPWEYAWVGFNGSDAPIILKATDFTPSCPVIANTPYGKELTHQLRHIYEVRGNDFESAVEMTGRLYTALAVFLKGAGHTPVQNNYHNYVQKAIEYISAHYPYPITVKDIADYAGLSRRKRLKKPKTCRHANTGRSRTRLFMGLSVSKLPDIKSFIQNTRRRNVPCFWRTLRATVTFAERRLLFNFLVSGKPYQFPS